MAVTEKEIERAYRNDMSLRRRLSAHEWQTYLGYSLRLPTLSERWAHDPLASVQIIDTRVQLLRQMLADGHSIHGVDMLTLLGAYTAQLQWTWQQLSQPPTPDVVETFSLVELAFMRETLRPDHLELYKMRTLRCDHVLRTDPKIFVPGIAGLGRS